MRSLFLLCNVGNRRRNYFSRKNGNNINIDPKVNVKRPVNHFVVGRCCGRGEGRDRYVAGGGGGWRSDPLGR